MLYGDKLQRINNANEICAKEINKIFTEHKKTKFV